MKGENVSLNGAREKLLCEKKEILVSMSRISADFTLTDFDDENPLDSLVTEKIQLERSLEKLRKIDESILQIEKGTYGICSCCGSPIPPKRLEILPGTDLCVGCARQAQLTPPRVVYNEARAISLY